jgi:predicted PP-loop superfamily ATPase
MPSHYIITYRVNYKKAIHRPGSKKHRAAAASSGGNTSHDKSFASAAAAALMQHYFAREGLKGVSNAAVKKKKHPLIVFAARPRGKTTSLCALAR